MNGVSFAIRSNVGDKTHVEHAIRFVHDQNLHSRQHQSAAFEMVQQATGRGDQHVNTAIQFFVLILERDAANQQRHGKFVVFAVALEALRDLGGEFPGWLKNQRARHARPGAAPREQLDHGKCKRCGFTRARLRNSDDISALEHLRYSARLDWGGNRITEVLNGAQQARTKAQTGKTDFVGGYGGNCGILRNLAKGAGVLAGQKIITYSETTPKII